MIFSQNVIYKVSNIGDGNMDFRFGDKHQVEDSRHNFFDKNKIDIHKTICMNVINHKDDFLEVSKKDFSRGVFDLESAPKVDALITKDPEVFLMLLVADCLPISVFDPVRKVTALIHASSKNTKLNIAGKIINVLKNKFSSKPKNLLIAFGPSIKKESYFMDVNYENKQQLFKAGILNDNIEEDKTDTYKSHKYFSHRRSEIKKEAEGRLAIVLGFRD